MLQLDSSDPLIQLSEVIPWPEFEEAFPTHYSKDTGAPSKPIRLMLDFLLPKQLEVLSDKNVVIQFKRSPNYQVFCDLTKLNRKLLCDT
ncbi:MAG: transposase [Cocleimonas sp.]|nr:transposase [Cocleimonas sp.]